MGKPVAAFSLRRKLLSTNGLRRGGGRFFVVNLIIPMT